MARQDRAEETRRKIINAAVEVFTDFGYARAGLNDIVARSGVTKGALYFHFDSNVNAKESLAIEISREGQRHMLDAISSVLTATAPALEKIIHATFLSSQCLRTDRMARCGRLIDREIGERVRDPSKARNALLAGMADIVDRAITEGDLRKTLDPREVAETLLAGMLGIQALSRVESDYNDLSHRIGQFWRSVLPAWAEQRELAYLLEFLERSARRDYQSVVASPPTRM